MINMMELKVNLLRCFGVYKPVNINEPSGCSAEEFEKKKTFLWICTRKVLTFLCFLFSEIFAFFRKSDIICVCCVPKGRS